MICLTSGKSLAIGCMGNINYTVTYATNNGTTFTEGTAAGSVSGGEATLLGPPSTGRILVRSIMITAISEAWATIVLYNGADYRIISSTMLNQYDNLTFDDNGISVINTSGDLQIGVRGATGGTGPDGHAGPQGDYGPWGQSISGNSTDAFFGNGSMGDVILDGTPYDFADITLPPSGLTEYRALSDIHANNLTMGGIPLRMMGYRLFVKGVMQSYGTSTILANGSNAPDHINYGGSGATGWGGTNHSGSGYIGRGGDGGGNDGSQPESLDCACGGNGGGGYGGMGYNDGGFANRPPFGENAVANLVTANSLAFGGYPIAGGAGGAGGYSGGGGGGGGVLVANVRSFTGDGFLFTAQGGNANGDTGANDWGASAGGGGGGGGVIVVITADEVYTQGASLVLNASGGGPGLGAGESGQDGKTMLFIV
jgi:hypothetical protein